MNLIAGSVKLSRPVVSKSTSRLTSTQTSFNDPFFNNSIEAFKSLSLHFHSNLWHGNLWNSSSHVKLHFQVLRPAEPSRTRHLWRAFTCLFVCSTARFVSSNLHLNKQLQYVQICSLNASSAALASWSLGSSRSGGAFSKSSIYNSSFSRASKHSRICSLLQELSFSLEGMLYSYRWRPIWNDLARPRRLFEGRGLTRRK